MQTYAGHALKMNKCSTSLSSSHDVQYNTDPMFIHQTIMPLPSNQNVEDDNESLTDVSIIIRTKQSFTNSNQPPRYYHTSIEHAINDQYAPDDQLFQSLVAYADKFNSDGSVYSTQDIKDQLSSTESKSSKIRTQSSTSHVTSFIENHRLPRHKSCDNLIGDNKSTMTESQNSTKLIPSNFFSSRKLEEDDSNEKHSDQSTTITDRSKFEWGYLSDSMNNSHRSLKGLFNNYEETTNINNLNSNYLQDLERYSTMDFSSSSINIPKKNKDVFMQQHIDIQVLQPSKPAPIIIREILHKPPPSATRSIPKHLSGPSTTYRPYKPSMTEKRKIIYERAAPPIPHKRHTNEQAKRIIIEYDQINVTIDKNIRQRKEIKRVNPNHYIEQYGSSLYSNQAFHTLFKNIIS